MTVRILDSAFLVDFYERGFSIAEFRSALQQKVQHFADQFQNEKLKGWNLYFNVYYNNVNDILIFLKGRSMPSDCMRQITIHIPMPVKSQAGWGVDQQQHIYKDPDHLNNIIKNFSPLPVDFTQFDNMKDYASDSMQRAVAFCFEHGFTVNGVKMKGSLLL